MVRSFMLAVLMLVSASLTAEVFYQSKDKFGDLVISNHPSPGATKLVFDEPKALSSHQFMREQHAKHDRIKNAQHELLIAKIVFEHATMRRKDSHEECLRQVKKLELIKRPGTYFTCRYLDISEQENALHEAQNKLVALQNAEKTHRN